MTLSKPVLAAASLLLLAGCSATHVGDSWQCPLAQGTECTTVAGADPMVPDGSVADEAAAKDVRPVSTPLYRAREPGEPVAVPHTARSCDGGCEDGFAPLAWLSGFFARIVGEDETAEAEPAVDARGDRPAPVAADTAAPVVTDTDAAPLPGEPQPPAVAESSTGALPADGESVARSSDGDEAASLPADEPFVPDTALRSPEVIGRIWIAPFVDADGHYREGSWVRAVLAPAGWRVR